MSDDVTIARRRIDRVVEILSCASVGAFDDALTKAEVEGQDDFAMLEEALRLVITELHQARRQSEETMQALERSRTELEEKLQTIESQRLAIADLSAPILDLWDDVVTLPVIGAIDTRRAVEMTERLLRRLVETNARCAIIDLTGVEVVDSMTADHLIKMIKAVRLLGCFCVVTGIGPEIARTLVELDVSLGDVRTLRNLRTGLEACFEHLASRPGRAAARRVRHRLGSGPAAE
ncbi:MAG: STAS domain-containing protein [Myxococcota bacterium]